MGDCHPFIIVSFVLLLVAPCLWHMNKYLKTHLVKNKKENTKIKVYLPNNRFINEPPKNPFYAFSFSLSDFFN